MQKYKFKKGDYVTTKLFPSPNDLYQITRRCKGEYKVCYVYNRDSGVIHREHKETYGERNFNHAPLDLYLEYLKAK